MEHDLAAEVLLAAEHERRLTLPEAMLLANAFRARMLYAEALAVLDRYADLGAALPKALRAQWAKLRHELASEINGR